MKSTCFWTAVACFFLFSLLRFPAELLAASAHSLSLWLTAVFPSLFPFLAVTGILWRLGAAEALGRLLQPVMRPLFRLSGICAFPLFLGLVSGYPMGAKLTAQLYENHQLSLSEAKKLLAFCNHPGPLFLVGTVGAEFFHSTVWGYAFLFSVVAGAFAAGLLFRPLPAQALPPSAGKRTQKKEGISFLLSVSVRDALTTTAQIGGYMVFFGAFCAALEQNGFFSLLGRLFSFLPVSREMISALGTGLLEMTNGAAALSQCTDSPKLLLTGALFLTAFGGASILGQTMDLLAPVPISSLRCLFYQALNGVLACAVFLLTYDFWEKQAQKAVPVFSSHTETAFSPWVHMLLLFLLLLGLLSFRKSRK
ncbi:hypothetical protein H9X85_06795 [Anaerotignum lactatifermentans]|uniref:Nucleoside transporter/FeoB GTPase Gate domain-containing protein n=1 Tax=Anaerotignum lactatifermentans TaxID=160404 RepID=A0ABS2G9F6_9FIRM|nr:nucleoside recognition domain-containing protein [Anaerotignum lactatifermentans]MBM6829346.1 hypothetical protein [Anaerotignum lactatifermentans]MBM6877413.1 hypothetical protein [Anaerotignum lactatifermentans]MBM6950923.1 hypothetical protein [Anaerotignum lactatifermentans]